MDTHSIFTHGQTLISRNHRKDAITVFPASMQDGFLVAKGAGEWMLGCQIHGRDLFLLHNTVSGDSQGYDLLQMPHLSNGGNCYWGGDKIAFWKVSDIVRTRTHVSDTFNFMVINPFRYIGIIFVVVFTKKKFIFISW